MNTKKRQIPTGAEPEDFDNKENWNKKPLLTITQIIWITITKSQRKLDCAQRAQTFVKASNLSDPGF